MHSFHTGHFLTNKSTMRRIIAIALATVLVVGTLVLPILHLAHCHDDDSRKGHEGHDSAHCPICHLINTPLHDAAPQIETVAAPAVYVFISISPRLVFAAVPGGSARARAPPAA